MLLAISATMLSIAPLTHMVTSVDGSVPGPAVGTGWLAVLPLVVVVVALAVDRTVGAAAIVGVGVFAMARLIQGVGLIISPDGVLRPEWFGVDAVSAFPLRAAWGATLPLVADLLAVAALALCLATVLDGIEPPTMFADESDAYESSAGESSAGESSADGSAAAATDGRRRVFRATPVTVVGLLASALVLASMLGVPYAQPLPVVPPLGVADIGLWSTGTAALAGLLLCIVVVSAAVLPTRSARGLLFGIAAATAVGPLTPIVGGLGNPAVHASVPAWLGLLGSLGLVVAGVLKRDLRPDGTSIDERTAASTDDLDAAPPAAWHNPALGALTLVAAGLSVLAHLRPQAVSSGGATGASFAAAGAGFLPAAVLLFVVGVLVLIPAACPFGRLALRVAWVPVLGALLTSLEFTSSSIWLSAGTVQRAAGTWWGLAAAALAGAAATIAPMISARARHASAEVVDTDEIADRSPALTAAAGVLTVLAVVAYALPVYTTNGHPAASLFVSGSRLDGWGAWICLIVVVATIWSAVRQERRSAAIAMLAAAAAVVGTRLAILPSVRAQLDFSISAGFWVTALLVLGLLVAAPVSWRLIGAPELLAGTAGSPAKPVPAKPAPAKPAPAKPAPAKPSPTKGGPARSTSRKPTSPRGKRR